jgi:hypothetical protein
MKMKRHLFELVVAIVSVGACCTQLASTQTATPPPSTPMTAREARSRVQPTGLSASGGSILNGVYSNSIYGFSMQIPPGWAVVPTQAARISQAGAMPMDTQQTQAQKLATQRQLDQVVLIMTENKPLKKSVERKGVQIIATHLPNTPGPTAAEGYIAYSQQMAKEKGLPVEYKGSPEKLTIHDQPFDKINLEETIDGSLQHIQQYVTTRGQALLQFLLISPEETGLATLQPVIQSVQFKSLTAKPTKKSSKTAQKTQK